MVSRSAIAELFLTELGSKEYESSAAIDVVAHRAELDSSGGALVMTLAAPGTEMKGKVILAVLTEASNGASIQFPQAGATVTRSLSVLGEAILLFGIDDDRWLTVVLGVSQAGAYTQTYSTADRTHAARTAAALTENGGAIGGTNDGDLPDLSSPDAATNAAAIREIAIALNKLVVDQADTAQVVNAVVDDLQAHGLAG
ncbi:MAG: hypothetical protein P1V97_31825 [Planctomycetota bacterium]|nr:hypothetical protein [Planctomycetota bacterium]